MQNCSKKHAVYTVPMQLKENVSMWNIYDLLISNFIATTKNIQGIKVYNPIIFNVNWNKTQQLLQKNNIDINNQDQVDQYIESCKQRIINTLHDYGITFSAIKDDRIIYHELIELLSWPYNDIWTLWKLWLYICARCGKNYGTNNEIAVCSSCGSNITTEYQEEIYQEINHTTLFQKINQIIWLKDWTKKKLISFIQSLPNTYNLLLSKDRSFTLSYNHKWLDPRFITIMSLLIEMYNNNCDDTTIIHWDVIKKYDYYMLCHTKPEHLPDRIIAHGNITNMNNQKISWLAGKEDNNYNISPKSLRYILLKNDIFKGVKLNESILEEQSRQASKYYLKITNILQNKTVSFNKQSNDLILSIWQWFIRSANNIQLWLCFNYATKLIDTIWKETKNENTISPNEYSYLQHLLYLYFWETWHTN